MAPEARPLWRGRYRLAMSSLPWLPAPRLEVRRDHVRRPAGHNPVRAQRKDSKGLKEIPIAPLFWPIY
jgi:hypothetical protein